MLIWAMVSYWRTSSRVQEIVLMIIGNITKWNDFSSDVRALLEYLRRNIHVSTGNRTRINVSRDDPLTGVGNAIERTNFNPFHPLDVVSNS